MTANPSTALATVVVDELARHGVTDAVIAPGSRSAPFALALHADDRIRLHVRIDERSAAFVALGWAKASRRPVPVVCTSGTAAANFYPAVLEADAAHVALLVLTADRPPELRGTGANQTVDQLKLYGTAVRWFCEVGVPEPVAGANAYWRSLTSRAVGEALGALGGPPGPVHLNCALREPLVPEGAGFPFDLDGRPGGLPWTAVPAAVRPPSPADVEVAAELVQGAERGLLVVGDTTAAPEPLVALAEAAGWPLFAEPLSGARAGPNAVAAYDAIVRDEAFWASHYPDVVVVVGRVGLSKALLSRLDADVPQVLVDAAGAWRDPRRALSRVIAADPDTLAAAVVDEVVERRDSPWLAAWTAADRRVRAAQDALLDADDTPSEPRTARDLAALAPPGSVLTVASSMPVRDLDAFMAPRRHLRVLANRGASGIDGFCSTAIGVAAAWDGPALALAGDLSLLHDVAGLLPAAGGLPDLVVVVANNDGGGIFSFLPPARHPAFEPVFATPHGVDLATLAAGLGVGHRPLERAGDLAATVVAAGAAGGVQLVEVRTQRDANVALHQRLREVVSAAVAGR